MEFINFLCLQNSSLSTDIGMEPLIIYGNNKLHELFVHFFLQLINYRNIKDNSNWSILTLFFSNVLTLIMELSLKMGLGNFQMLLNDLTMQLFILFYPNPFHLQESHFDVNTYY